MIIQYLSDLHLEFRPMFFQPSLPEPDVVVLAGDIGAGEAGVIWALQQIPDHIPIIYVPGNHEFYSSPTLNTKTMPSTLLAIHALSATRPNFYVLTNKTIIIDEVLFVGTTLWTDFALYGDPFIGEIAAQNALNDFAHVYTGPGTRLTARDTIVLHKGARNYLLTVLSAPPPKRHLLIGTPTELAAHPELPYFRARVVVTHHAPSSISIPERYRNDPLSPAFASDLSQLILETSPDLWIHGHVHDGCDYRIGDTRVVCNPRGYPDEPHSVTAPPFDPRAFVKV